MFSGALQLTDLDDFITPSQVQIHRIHSFDMAEAVSFLMNILSTLFLAGMHQTR